MLEQSLICDRIVYIIRSGVVRDRLLRVDDLSLDKGYKDLRGGKSVIGWQSMPGGARPDELAGGGCVGTRRASSAHRLLRPASAGAVSQLWCY